MSEELDKAKEALAVREAALKKADKAVAAWKEALKAEEEPPKPTPKSKSQYKRLVAQGLLSQVNA